MALPYSFSGIILPSSGAAALGPFQDGNGNLYVVLIDSTDTSLLECWKASASGDDWAEQDGSNRPDQTNSTFAAIGVYQDATNKILHIAAQCAGGQLNYYNFNTSDHASPNIWGTKSNDIHSPNVGVASPACAITLRSDGDRFIVYQGAKQAIKGTDYTNVDYALWEGVSWSVGNAIDNGGAVNYAGAALVRGASDKAHVFYKQLGATNNIQHKSFSSANSLSSAEAVNDNGVETSLHNLGAPRYYDAAGTERITFAWKRESDDKVYAAEIDNDGTPGAEEVVSGATVDLIAPFVTTSGADDIVYAHFVDSASSDIFHDDNDNSGGWGTDVETLDAVTASALFGNTFVRGSATIFGYFYNDGGTIKYNEYTLVSGGTPVSDTLSCDWHVRAQISDSSTNNWHVRAQISDSLISNWHVYTTIADSVIAAWNVYQTAADSLDAAWNLAAYVSDSLASDWHVRAIIADSLDSAWHVLISVADSFESAWAVRAAVADSFAADWHVAAQIADSLQSDWHVYSITSDTLDMDWRVYTTTADTLDVDWHTRAFASDTVNSDWHVRAQVSDNLAADWHVYTSIVDSLISDWHVYITASDSLTSDWHILAQVADTLGADWNILAIVSDDLISAWHVLAQISDVLVLEWNVLVEAGTVSDAVVLAWHVRQIVSDAFNAEWFVLNSIADALLSDWNIAVQIGDTLNVDWHVRAIIADSLASAWNIRALVSDSQVLAWHVLSEMVKGYVILGISNAGVTLSDETRNNLIVQQAVSTGTLSHEIVNGVVVSRQAATIELEES